MTMKGCVVKRPTASSFFMQFMTPARSRKSRAVKVLGLLLLSLFDMVACFASGQGRFA